MKLKKYKMFTALNILLFSFLVSIPLYLTEAYRLSIGGLTLPLNIVLLGLIFIFLFRNRKIIKIDKDMLYIIYSLLLFLIMHFISFEINIVGDISIAYVIKFILSIILFFMAYKISNLIFVRENIFIKYSIVASIASSLVLASLIYFYFFILHSDALGIMLNDMSNTHAGKNQLQVYLVLMIPLLVYQISKRPGFLLAISLIVHLTAMIYVGSRGLWVSLMVGFMIYAIPTMIKSMTRYKFTKSSFKRIILLFLLLLIFIPIMTDFETGHILAKFDSLLELTDSIFSSHVQLNKGMGERSMILSQAYDLFSNNIILGNGLGYFQTHNSFNKLTHNEYMFFLTDMGVITFFIFLIFEILLLLKLKKNAMPLYLLIPFFIDLLFVNAYTFPLFWILAGFYVGIKKLDRRNI